MTEISVEQLKDAARKAARAGDTATAKRLIARAQSAEKAAPSNVVWQQGDSRVVRGPSGLSFVSPGYSTSDPDKIAELMRGKPISDVTRAGFQDEAIADSPVRSRLASAVQGVPFLGQYADEAVGLLHGDVERDRRRFLADAVNERKPGQALGLKLGAGILASLPAVVAAPAVAAAAPASMVGRTATGLLGGLALGAAEGAVSGYGAGTDNESRAQTSGEWAAQGGLLGGLTGGLVPLASSGVRRTADFVLDRLSGQGRRIPGLSREASEQILLRARADDIGGEGAGRIAAAGPDGMVADAGPAMQGLSDLAVNMSPSGANIAGRAVNQRAANSSRNLAQTFDDILGEAQGQTSIARAIRADARPGVNAAYSGAYSKAIDYSSEAGRNIEDIIDRMPPRVVREAARKAAERMKYDGVPVPQVLLDIADDGTITASELKNVMQVDYIKRALDAVARDGTDITGKMSDDAAFAARMARDIRDALKDAVPEYGVALDRASDAFALENARRMGETLLRSQTRREAVSDWLSGAGTLERQAAALALRSDIDERMANATRAAGAPEGIAEARKIFRDLSSAASRAKVRAVVGDEADAIFKAIDEAEAALELKTAVAKNSATAPRTAADANLRAAREYSPLEIGREMVSGGVLSGPRRAAQVFAGNTPADVAARDDALYGEIARYLTGERGPGALQQAAIMQGLLNYIPQASARAARIGQTTGAGLGLLGYQSATQAQR